MQRKLNDTIICLRIGKTYTAKTPPSDFKVTTPENSLLSQQAVTSKRIAIPYTNLQLNPYPNTQLNLFCSDNFSFSMHGSQYVTNQFDARIPVRGLLLCTNPSTWLTPQQPSNCCSWFAVASHRDTNKIFNVGARDFAWLQNPKAYKKHSKNSFSIGGGQGFKKKTLWSPLGLGFFFFHLL